MTTIYSSHWSQLNTPLRLIWRAVLGGTLGFVAGILAFALIAGGILSGSALPDISSAEPTPKDLALSILWAVGSGSSFEWIFERVRGATEGGS